MILPFALGVFVGTALGFTFAGLLVGGRGPKARVAERRRRTRGKSTRAIVTSARKVGTGLSDRPPKTTKTT